MALETTTAPHAGLTRSSVEQLSSLRREPGWLLQLRLDAFTTYERLPLPDQRTEGWRRTSLAGLDLTNQAAWSDSATLEVEQPSSTGALPAPVPVGEPAGLFVQINGASPQVELDRDLERRGVVLMDLADAARDPAVGPRVQSSLGQLVAATEDKLTALHYAFLNSGAFVYVPRGVTVDGPIHLRYLFSRPSLGAFAHTLVMLEESAACSLVEDHWSASQSSSRTASGVVEMVVANNAQARYTQVQRWTDDVRAFNWQRARLGADAHLRTLTVALGGRLARNTVQVYLDGRGSQADLLAVVAGRGNTHADFETLQSHLGDGTRSDLVIHNALWDHASTNFTGLIRINKPAHRTESSQQQKNVLLSPTARADSDPKLEILNNDVVRCTHGASIGPMDAETVFYLQSRGLDHQSAEQLVLEGFFRSVLQRMQQPSLEAGVWETIAHMLGQELAL